MQEQWNAKRFGPFQDRNNNTFAGVDITVAANLGGRGGAYSRVSTTHRVLQRAGRRAASEADVNSART